MERWVQRADRGGGACHPRRVNVRVTASALSDRYQTSSQPGVLARSGQKRWPPDGLVPGSSRPHSNGPAVHLRGVIHKAWSWREARCMDAADARRKGVSATYEIHLQGAPPAALVARFAPSRV